MLYKEGSVMKNNLEQLRKVNNLSQDEFANLMGVSRQTISSLENGRYNPSIVLAFKIARYFKLKVEDVFMMEEEDYE